MHDVAHCAGSTLSLNDVCVQSLLPGQPPASCVFELIANNGTLWYSALGAALNPPSPPSPKPPASFPPPSPSGGTDGGGGGSSGLSGGEKTAVIVVSIIGGLILIGLALAVLYICFRRKQKKWAPAKGEFDGVAVAAAAAEQGAEPSAPPEEPATVPGTPTTVQQSSPAQLLDEDEAGPSGLSPPPPEPQQGGRPVPGTPTGHGAAPWSQQG